MKRSPFQKIWLWFQLSSFPKNSRKGALTLVTIFLSVVFSTLGLGMIYVSQVYLKMSSFRKNSIVLEYASENGIKQGYDLLIQSLSQRSSPSIITEEKNRLLKSDAMRKGMEAIEVLLGKEIPLEATETWENLKWTSITTFFLQKYFDREDYFRTFFTGLIDSEGTIENFGQFRYSSLETALEVSFGNIPLSTIPILLDKDLTPVQKDMLEVYRHSLVSAASEGA